MATTIIQSFQQLKQNLEPTGLQKSTIATRQNSVRDVLQSELKIQDSFLTGSYSRATLIGPLKEVDVDVFVVLDNSYFYTYDQNKNGGQAGLLDLVKRTLRKTYTRTPDISRNGQAVTIRFDDFMVDVVPGFNRNGGGYLIPNSISQSWLSTDPKKHVDLVSQANAAHNGNLIPLIKMIKGWNKNNGERFRSFHLEVLALAIFSGITISDSPSGARYFFDKGRGLISGQNLDPAGYGGDVGSYINTQDGIKAAVSSFQSAFDRAIRAEASERSGQTRAAVEAWSLIFGSYFPAYG